MMDEKPIANLQPHYTDDYFKKPRTVWMAEGYKTVKDSMGYEWIKDAEYNYSDRIWQWDWNKADSAQKAVDTLLDRRSPAYIQAFLRLYFEKPNPTLVHVMAGFNVSNGFPYQVYGYLLNEAQP
jgi:hypothetical protein